LIASVADGATTDAIKQQATNRRVAARPPVAPCRDVFAVRLLIRPLPRARKV
jgi:hypothetical protein